MAVCSARARPFAARELQQIAARAAGRRQVIDVPSAGPNGARAAVVRQSLGGDDYLVMAIQPLDELAADLAVLRRVLLIALPLAIVLAGVGGYWLTRRNLMPLDSMAEQARRITHSTLETRLDAGPAAADELATLSASFNELLSRLDQSFDHMRRFVADASHELRTPISIIRGEADVALAQDRSAAEYKQALAARARRIAPPFAPGGRSVESGARRCRPREAARRGVLPERSAGGMLPLCPHSGRRAAA